MGRKPAPQLPCRVIHPPGASCRRTATLTLPQGGPGNEAPTALRGYALEEELQRELNVPGQRVARVVYGSEGRCAHGRFRQLKLTKCRIAAMGVIP